jgi:hypothetical protein
VYEENVVLIFKYVYGLSIYSDKGKKILWVSLFMLFFSFSKLLINQNPITPNTACNKTACEQRQKKKSDVLSDLPSFLSTVFDVLCLLWKRRTPAMMHSVRNGNDRKINKSKTRQGKKDDGNSEIRVNLQGKVDIRSSRHAQDGTVAVCFRLQYHEASFQLSEA